MGASVLFLVCVGYRWVRLYSFLSILALPGASVLFLVYIGTAGCVCTLSCLSWGLLGASVLFLVCTGLYWLRLYSFLSILI